MLVDPSHIVVNPRKARPPKACSKPGSAPDKAAHKKMAIRKKKEEDDDKSRDDENDDESADEAMQELTDKKIGGDAKAVSTISFQIGEKVINCADLRGIIEHSHDDFTYDIAYNDGRKDFKVQARHIKPVPAGRILLFLYITLCAYAFICCQSPPVRIKDLGSWTWAVDESLASASAEVFVTMYELGDVLLSLTPQCVTVTYALKFNSKN